jgi:acetolactate synthase-1/2/3 large subunit
MAMTGGEIVVRALEDEEVPFTFGIPGTHNIELYDALADARSIWPVLVTDEQSASFMADAVWRASGRLGCVNVVPGAGLTHALSGIAEAYLDCVPLLVLGCGIRRDTGRAYQLHDIDQAALVAPVTKAQLRPAAGAEVYGAVRRACALARGGRPGPVFVEIPAEHYLFRADASPAELQAAFAAEGVPAAPIDAQALERAIAVLAGARRPLLYLGLGAAGAGAQLPELAERLSAPVATTLQGKGVFPESYPLALWPGFGASAPPFARKLAESCDATLAIGCRFGEVGTGSYGLTPPGPLVHVDIDADVFGRNFPPAVAVQADAATFVRALLERLPHRAADPSIAQAIARGREEVRAHWDKGVGVRVSPWTLLSALQARLGPDAIYTTDSGNGTFLAAEMLQLDAPGRLLAPIDFSCMGYAVPAAVGAALARPGAPVVALAGDGAFLMTGLELITAVSQQVPLAVFVLRDRELAQIAQFQATALGRKTASRLGDYDLVELCAGLGVECLRLDANDAVAAVLERVVEITADGWPVVVDVAIDYSQRTFFTAGVVKTNLLRLPWADRLRFIGRALSRRVFSGREARSRPEPEDTPSLTRPAS